MGRYGQISVGKMNGVSKRKKLLLKKISIKLENMNLGVTWTVLWILMLQLSELCAFKQIAVFFPLPSFYLLDLDRASLYCVLNVSIPTAAS